MPGDNKTEKPTPRRIQRAREEGNVPKSNEINSVAVLLGGLLLLILLTGKFFRDFLMGSFYGVESFISPERLNGHDIAVFWVEEIKRILLWIFLALSAIFAIAVVSNIAQFGFLFSLKILQPRFSKLNPITGIKNLFFSLNSLFELAKNLIKIAVIIGVAYFFIKAHLLEILSLYKLPLWGGITELGSLAVKLTAYIIATGIAIAVIDYAFRRWKWEKDLMMTREEVKEEYKQTEGNPEVKRELRRRMRQVMTRRMIQEVPKATVVITNPTHFAVALKYDIERDRAPKVVAKGADDIAQKIIEVAKKHGVEIYREPPLARALYYSVEVGQEIPERFYKAVAKIIAYVLSVKAQNQRR